MNNLKEINLDNKRVIVRVDFNTPLNKETGEIDNDFRIKAHLDTINFLIKNNAKVVLISHLGKPKGREVGLSLKKAFEKLKTLVDTNVYFSPECIGQEVKKQIEQLKPREIIVLENTRFHPEEYKNNENFAAQLAQLGDIFVQDAFSACHRDHASITGITKFLPKYKGLLLEKELNALSKALKSPKKPLITIIGGVKIATKTDVITSLLKTSDAVLLGGKIANTILKFKDICPNNLINERDIVEAVRKIDLNSANLIVPIDGIIGKEESSRGGSVDTVKEDEGIFDIGVQTIDYYKKIIAKAETIIWNGPLGLFEKEVFSKGTLEIGKAVADSHAYSIVGGGETIDFLKKNNILDKIDFVSGGGGAMLEFMAQKKLPGLEALDKDL